jgi:hypothetical protein
MIFKQKRRFAVVLPAVSAMFLVAIFSGAAFAQTHSEADTKKDILRHKAMAAAHEGAAKCLETGKKHEVCEKELQAACKGLGIGKNCGMRHEH